MARYWFRNLRAGREIIGLVKPLTWEGWTVQIGMVFLMAMLAQAVGRWMYVGFQPLGAGFWLLAGVFLLLGFYLRIVKRYSEPRKPDNRPENRAD